MLTQPMYAITDPAALRAIIAAHGWATLVSATADALVVSHLPVIPGPAEAGPGAAEAGPGAAEAGPGAAEAGSGLAEAGACPVVVLGHLAREDADAHDLGNREVVLIVQGTQGYISPRLYRTGPYVPTWNFAVVHLHGVPEVLDDERTYQVLSETVDHFEAGRDDPFALSEVAAYAHRIAGGVTGFRLRPSRVTGKVKASQDKPADVVRRVTGALREENPALATLMAAANDDIM